MRLPLPETLFGRLFAATVAVVAAALLLIVFLVLRERRELAFSESGSGAAAASIAEISQALASMPPDQRDATLAQLRADRMSMERRRAHDRPHQDLALAQRAFAGEVQKQLGSRFAVDARPSRMGRRQKVVVLDPSPGDSFPGSGAGTGGREGPPPRDRMFDLLVTLPDGDLVTFRTFSPRGTPPFPGHFIIELGLLTLMLSIVLYAMTRTITRPLGDLAAAADAVGRGTTIAPLKERGARELKRATRAFNAMQERLNRYLDSRTRVLAAMSHDLRTPITRLRLRVESIEDEALRARCIDDLNEMTSMVRNALGIFRGMNDEEPAVPVDINALLQELQQRYAEVSSSVAVEGRAAAPINGKPLALKRCLGNLVDNALQYGQHATLAVTDGADELTIRVLDDGPGIPPQEIERVFEPFYRLESSRNRATGGTGLGLSIARDVAQAHGGSLALANRSEGGLEARLVLPRRRNGDIHHFAEPK
ncbi:MAG TPA: ATP-binding protein [Steroidobacteraceae bacterium]|nr:ATP-binding protein [Steroidobacteraceae bacterium]